MYKNTMETSNEEQSQTFANDAANIDIPEKILQIADGTPSRNQYLERRMQKVPPLLRQDTNYQRDYDPLVVSLGPYHHGKEGLQSAEDFKLTALQMFVAGSGRDAVYFYSQVLEHLDYARNCYIEGSTKAYNDAAFAQMMLLDTCFIINVILTLQSFPENYRITRHHLGDIGCSIAIRDLIILENQIPFRILKHLMCLRYGKQPAEEMLYEFLTRSAFGDCKGSEIASRRDEELPLHLLEAYCLHLVPESSNSEDKPTTPQGPQSISSNESQSGCLKHMGNSVKYGHLGQHISNLPCFPWRERKKDDGKSIKKYIHCFRSATDLKAKGIHFRPSTTDSLMGIKFKSGYFYAQLELPTWFVTVHTKVFFLNLTAYEFCPSATTDRAVAAYIEFMKSLIDNPTDVKELREKRILFTTLGSDEEVVKVCKEINTYAVSNVVTFYNVKEEIQAHYNNKAKTWLAELFYTYFRSPWTTLALFAAAFLLVLTFLQTYYTVRRS